MKYITILMLFTLTLFAEVKGSTLYNSCQYCHGIKADKVYADQVPAINNMDAKTLQAVLELYKKGEIDTYGFGPIMKTQMKNIPTDKISILAEYIANL